MDCGKEARTARIAIDIRVTQGGYPGIGRATLCLVEALLRRRTAHQFLLLYDTDRPVPVRILAAVAGPHRLLATGTSLREPADQWTTPRRLRAARVELLHSPYYAQALAPGCPYVLEVFDLIPEFYRQYWPSMQGMAIRLWLRRAALGARQLIAPSQSSARDLVRTYGIAEERITVAPLAADVGWLGDKDRGGRDDAGPKGRHTLQGQQPAGADVPGRETLLPRTSYLLCVCTNKPHKNLTRLMEAYGLLQGRVEHAPDLVIAGGWDERYPEPAMAAARLGAGRAGSTVRFVRHPDDATLREIYQGAIGFVFPSEYEGFGLPVLEAMAMGLPVAASKTPAVAEVAGDACLSFDPTDVQAIAQAMERLAGEPSLRSVLRAASTERAAHFSWEETAARTLAAYEAALCV